MRKILEALLDWFEMEEGREQYIRESSEQICIGAVKGTEYVGFLCLKETGKYEDYDDTKRFYIRLGFKEYEVFPTLRDEANPCQIYVMSVER